MATCALLSFPLWAADLLPVRYPEGSARAFLLVRSPEGKVIAEGDFTQILRRDVVISHLVFRFRDGSRDDDETQFSQHRCFRLLRDHHIQNGPSFPHPTEMTINTAMDQVTVRDWDTGGRLKEETEHLDLPPDLTNGILLHILKNIPNTLSETKVSYLAATPKPRVVQLVITRQEPEAFLVAGIRYRAKHFRIKTELGGFAGVIAPMIGKEPADVNVWVAEGDAPVLVRVDGPLYLGGPVWSIQLTTPVWTRHSQTSR